VLLLHIFLVVSLELLIFV